MSTLSPSNMVLYLDEDILVINKPAGVLSLQDGYDKSLPHLSTILEPDFGSLLMVHRLDRETSGVIILARTVDAHRSLNQQFQNRSVQKVYHAIVRGIPSWNDITVNFPLRKNGDRNHRTVVDYKLGKKASTGFCILEKFNQHTMVEARPHSGYTHQIRIHLSHLGFPILADMLYGKNNLTPPQDLKENSGLTSTYISRLALHAASITIIHPSNSEVMTFTAPYPEDFVSALSHLRLTPKN